MKKLTFCLLFICIGSYAHSQVTSYLAEGAVNSVVLLEKKVDDVYFPHGTGFLLQSYDENKPVIVVTNEHLLRNRYIYVTIPADSELLNYNNIKNKKSVVINGEKWEILGNKLRLQYELIPDSTFISDSVSDVAAFKIKIGNSISINETTKLKISNMIGIGWSNIKYKKDIQLGTEIFFIGFPFSIGTEMGVDGTKEFSTNIPTPLIRKGIVSWKSPAYDVFLLDAFSYRGNSGSPIFTIKDIQNRPYLIGIVAGHLPSDFSDNAGLAKCVWADKILELIKKLK
jgi:hypothetical protein